MPKIDVAEPMGNFYTDVIQTDRRYHSIDVIRDTGLLAPMMRAKISVVIQQAGEQGLELVCFETYRSQERQQILFDHHVTQLRTVGVHHYGLAADLVRNVGGQPSWKGDFSLLGHLARANGLVWGGDWGNPNIPHSFRDPYHLQWCSLVRQSDLFAGRWYPDDGYDPYNDHGTAR